MTTENHSSKDPERLNQEAYSLVKLYQASDDKSTLDQAIHMQQLAVQLTPLHHPDYSSMLHSLGDFLSIRFERVGDIRDLQRAIDVLEQVIQRTAEQNDQLPSYLSSLGLSLSRRFTRTGSIADITQAISHQRRAVQIASDSDPHLNGWLNNLALALSERSQRTGDVEDISESIAIRHRALDITPIGDPITPLILNNIAVSYIFRFKRRGSPSDLSDAIKYQTQGVDLTPASDPQLPMWLGNLAGMLMYKFTITGHLRDVSEAISFQRRALSLLPPDHARIPWVLTSLGSMLSRLFQHSSNLQAVEEAITLQQRSVNLSSGDDAALPGRLIALGTSLMYRYWRTADLSDLSSSISAQRKAIQLTSGDDAQLPERLSGLCTTLTLRSNYSRDHNVVDMAEAITLGEKAVQLLPQDHPQKPDALNNLALAYRSRFQKHPNINDADASVTALERAVSCVPASHGQLPGWLANLGIALRERSEYTNESTGLVQSIDVLRRAILSTPSNHAQLLPMCLAELAKSLKAQFALDSGLSKGSQDFVRFTPDGIPADSRHNDSMTKHVDHSSLLSEAISALEQALSLIPDAHSKKYEFLLNLGNTSVLRFFCLGDPKDIQLASSSFELAARGPTPAPSDRLLYANRWAEHCLSFDKANHLQACKIVIDTLSLVAGVEETIEVRYARLIGQSKMTSKAVGAALEADEFDTALEWLEQGRCIVWNQLNQLRTSSNELRNYDGSLASRFLELSQALEMASSRRVGHLSNVVEGGSSSKVALEEEKNTHLKPAKEWETLLEEIRCIPRFSDFLRPRTAQHLMQRLPTQGLTIIVNVDKMQANALVLIHGLDEPLYIRLPHFHEEKAQELRNRLQGYLIGNGVRARSDDRAVRRVQRSLNKGGSETLRDVLQILWLKVILPIFDAVALQRSTSDRVRIWWCATGPLAFLPLHAAGIYKPGGSCIADYAVSSYTPTITSLIDKVQQKVVSNPKMLVISQADAPDLPKIPGTTEETDMLQQMAIGQDLSVTRLDGAEATVGQVSEEMRESSWIHLACHAKQDGGSPLQSSFYLRDGCLTLSDIIKHHNSNADFAFLSACQTSTGNEKLAEEAVHLAAGMLAANYRGVVATMWSIKDQYGVQIAKAFYEHLMPAQETEKGWLDSSKAAFALHHATQDIRRRMGDTEEALLTWVPYVHFGV